MLLKIATNIPLWTVTCYNAIPDDAFDVLKRVPENTAEGLNKNSKLKHWNTLYILLGVRNNNL